MECKQITYVGEDSHFDHGEKQIYRIILYGKFTELEKRRFWRVICFTLDMAEEVNACPICFKEGSLKAIRNITGTNGFCSHCGREMIVQQVYGGENDVFS